MNCVIRRQVLYWVRYIHVKEALRMKYLIANSTAEVLEFLKEAGGTASILAGGTDLVLDIESGKKKADTLVDVTRIPELKKLKK